MPETTMHHPCSGGRKASKGGYTATILAPAASCDSARREIFLSGRVSNGKPSPGRRSAVVDGEEEDGLRLQSDMLQ